MSELNDLIYLDHGSYASEEALKVLLTDIHFQYGIDIIGNLGGSWSVGHTDKSRSLYLDNCTVTLEQTDDMRELLSKVLNSKTGEETGPDCGKIKFWKTCSANPQHEIRPVYHNCHHATCPACGHYWISQAAERIEKTTSGYQEALSRYERDHGKPVSRYKFRHFSFNPSLAEQDRLLERAHKITLEQLKQAEYQDKMPVELLRRNFLDVLRNAANTWLEASGLDGAVLVPHFNRIKKEYKDLSVNLAKGLNESKKPWEPRFNRYTALIHYMKESGKAWHEGFYFSPHVHVIAYGKAIDTDSFVKILPNVRITNHSAKKRKGSGNIGGLAYYLLTHTPIIHGKKSITHWGCLHSSILKKTKIREEKIYETCPVCGADLVQCHVSDGTDTPEILDLTKEKIPQKVCIYSYSLRKGPP